MIKRIYQIGDIHVRLYKRHDEYKQVFNEFVHYIKNKSEDSLVVITGDVVHNKIDMSPELISTTSQFLKSVADILPVVMISGNHDSLLTNQSRLDALTPIVETLNHPNIHYFKTSGVYTVDNIDFGVFSFLDTNWPTDTARTSSNKRVALYHGMVSSAKTDTGFIIEDRGIPVSTFDNYDMTMLGDIHKQQLLSPTIAYNGSMIQQNFGEALFGHGFVEWDVETCTPTFHELRNDYCYFSMLVDNGKYDSLPLLPKNIRLRIFSSNTTSDELNKIVSILKNQYNIVEVVINKLSGLASSKEQIQKHVVDVSNVTNQNELIREFLKKNSDVSNENLIEIFKINEETNSKLKSTDVLKNVHWKLLKFEFSNMFCYGEKNIIDFQDKKGTYGLFAKNAEGKTSVFEALMFCLYDKTPRAYRAINVLNNRKTTFSCKATIELDNNVYIIERVGVKKKDGTVRVDVDFSKFDSLNQLVSLNGADRNGTNTNIKRYFGGYEEFILTNISTQHNSAVFLEKGQSDRKDILGQFLGIDIYDKLYEIASEKYREADILLKNYSIDETSNQLTAIQKNIQQLSLEQTSVNNHIESIKNNKKDLENLISTYTSQKEPVDARLLSLGNLESLKQEEEKNIQELETSHETSLKNTKELTEKKDAIQLYFSSVSGNIEKEMDELKNWRLQYSGIMDSISKLENEINIHDRNLKKLDEYRYNKDCDICLDNAKVYITQKQETEKKKLDCIFEKNSKNERALELFSKIENSKSIEPLYEEHKKKEREYGDIVAKLRIEELYTYKVSSLIPKAKSNLEKLIVDIENHHKMKESINKNNSLDVLIRDTKLKLDTENRLLEQKQRTSTEIYGKILVEDTRKKEILNIFDKMNKLSVQHKNYEYYLYCINRDGIPYQLISKTVPLLQTEINTILSQIVDFSVVLEMDGKNINAKIVYDSDRSWPLEMASGMERFVSSLAIRIALISISSLPKSNFMVIDEGFGSLSSDNLLNMQIVLQMVKEMFDWTIIITHLDSMKDMVDYIIHIEKHGGYSKIEST